MIPVPVGSSYSDGQVDCCPADNNNAQYFIAVLSGFVDVQRGVIDGSPSYPVRADEIIFNGIFTHKRRCLQLLLSGSHLIPNIYDGERRSTPLDEPPERFVQLASVLWHADARTRFNTP